MAGIEGRFGEFVSVQFWVFSGVSELVMPAEKKKRVPNTPEKQNVTVMDG